MFGTLRVRAVGTLFAAVTVAAIASVGAAAQPPTKVTPPEPGGIAMVQAQLIAHPGTWSGDGPMTYAYVWDMCDYPAPHDATCRSAAVGKYFTPAVLVTPYHYPVLTVTATDRNGESTRSQVWMQDPLAKYASPLENIALPKVFGIPAVGETLEATEGMWRGPRQTRYTFQGWRCDPGGPCEKIGSRTILDRYQVTAADAGKELYVDVQAESIETGERVCCPASARVLIAAPSPPLNTPVNTSPPTISGPSPPTVGDTLTASPGTWTNDPQSYTYQWRRCTPPIGSSPCDDISGAVGVNATSYTVKPEDVNEMIAVHVTATNLQGSGEKSSAETEPVQDVTIFVDPDATKKPGYYWGDRHFFSFHCCGGKRADGTRALIKVNSISPDPRSCLAFSSVVTNEANSSLGIEGLELQLETGIAKCGATAVNPCAGPAASGLYKFVERLALQLPNSRDCLIDGAANIGTPVLFTVSRSVVGSENWRAYIDTQAKSSPLNMGDAKTGPIVSVSEWGEHAWTITPGVAPPGCVGWSGNADFTSYEWYNLQPDNQWRTVKGATRKMTCWQVSDLSNGSFNVSH